MPDITDALDRFDAERQRVNRMLTRLLACAATCAVLAYCLRRELFNGWLVAAVGALAVLRLALFLADRRFDREVDECRERWKRLEGGEKGTEHG